MGLGAYIIRRLILLIPTVIGVTVLIFAITMLLSPLQRAALYVTSPQQARNLQKLVTLYHLDDPFQAQFLRWLQQVLSGNLGYSITCHDFVLKQIILRIPRTAEIVLPSIPIIVLLGIFLGTQSAVHRDTFVDHFTRFWAIFGWSLPTFWLAIMLLAIFYGWLGWFPPGTNGQPIGGLAFEYVTSIKWHTYTGLYTIDGLLNGQPWITWDAIKHLILPTMSLTIINVALIMRIMRSSMLESLGKSYIITAKAKGLKNSAVINKHARRNALIPVVTISGLLAAGLLTGVVITETIYGINGLGEMAARASLSRGVPDIPAVLGFAMFTCLVYVVANLIVDIAYGYVDPRIRLG